MIIFFLYRPYLFKFSLIFPVIGKEGVNQAPNCGILFLNTKLNNKGYTNYDTKTQLYINKLIDKERGKYPKIKSKYKKMSPGL